jgi:hypothetical protein
MPAMSDSVIRGVAEKKQVQSLTITFQQKKQF